MTSIAWALHFLSSSSLGSVWNWQWSLGHVTPPSPNSLLQLRELCPGAGRSASDLDVGLGRQSNRDLRLEATALWRASLGSWVAFMSANTRTMGPGLSPPCLDQLSPSQSCGSKLPIGTSRAAVLRSDSGVATAPEVIQNLNKTGNTIVQESSDFFLWLLFWQCFYNITYQHLSKMLHFSSFIFGAPFAVIFGTCWASCFRIQEASDTHLKAPWKLSVPGTRGSGAQFLSVWVGANTSPHTWLERSQVSELQCLSPVPMALGGGRKSCKLLSMGMRVCQRALGDLDWRGMERLSWEESEQGGAFGKCHLHHSFGSGWSRKCRTSSGASFQAQRPQSNWLGQCLMV